MTVTLRHRLSVASSALVIAAPVVGAAPLAHAIDRWDINGTFTATSIGDWAQSNHVYRDEASVRNTWTIAMTCRSPDECSGQVNSDAGWTAPIFSRSGMWVVKRTLPQWEPCPDGTAAEGRQAYQFYPANFDGQVESSTTYIGWDKTFGPSGACGINQPLAITMPFKLVRAG